MNDTPETDAKINSVQIGNNYYAMVCARISQKLERERDQARAEAERWRENWRNGASMSMIASSKLPWENDNDLARRALDYE